MDNKKVILGAATIVAVLVVWLLIEMNDNKSYKKEKEDVELKLAAYKRSYDSLSLDYENSKVREKKLTKRTDSLSTVVNKLKANSKKINEKHDKNQAIISGFSTDSTISYMSRRLSEKSGN